MYGLHTILVHLKFLFEAKDKMTFDGIIWNKNEHNIEAVVLGCTELPLLLNNDNCVLPCLDSVEIHIQKLIKLALGD